MNPQQMGMGHAPQMRSQLPGGQGPRGMPQPGMVPEHEENLNDPHGQMVSTNYTVLQKKLFTPSIFFNSQSVFFLFHTIVHFTVSPSFFALPKKKENFNLSQKKNQTLQQQKTIEFHSLYNSNKLSSLGFGFFIIYLTKINHIIHIYTFV